MIITSYPLMIIITVDMITLARQVVMMSEYLVRVHVDQMADNILG